MKRALEFADRKIKQLTSQITADAPKVLINTRMPVRMCDNRFFDFKQFHFH